MKILFLEKDYFCAYLELKESAIDQVQGMIHPPSKEILFNSNVLGDDGVLVDFIKRKYGVEEMPARTALAEFTNDLRLRIHRKEIIAIPDVGRLYLDFEKNVQFLPDRVNYNKDAFGLQGPFQKRNMKRLLSLNLI